LRTYCLVPSTWLLDECVRHTCDDNSHRHLSLREVRDLESDDLVEWIYRPTNRRDRGILRLRRPAIPPARGLSCRVGEALAVAVHLGLGWARTMLADIQSPTGF
jgi:hypothetical protein